MTSQKPYLIRALYEWCSDNGFTPHIGFIVDANTMVPAQFVRNNKMVLNIDFNACKNLLIDNEWVTFQATFSGLLEDIAIPVANIMTLFAKENGQGMQFELETYTPSQPAEKTAATPAASSPPSSGLKLVK